MKKTASLIAMLSLLSLSSMASDFNGVYEIEEGDKFSFFIGNPKDINNTQDLYYNTDLIESDDGLELTLTKDRVTGIAPEVDKRTEFIFLTETETGLEAPNDFVIHKYKVIVLDK